MLLVNRDSSNDQPVVVSVPPTESQNNNEIVPESQGSATSSVKMKEKDKSSPEDISDITESSGNSTILFLSDYVTVDRIIRDNSVICSHSFEEHHISGVLFYLFSFVIIF